VGDRGLDGQEAQRVLTDFPRTELAAAFNGALVVRLVHGGVSQAAAATWARRVAWNTPRFFNLAIAESKDKVKMLAELFSNGGRETLERFGSVDSYLLEKIEPLHREPVFDEKNFRFADIYVPLQAQWLKRDGKRDDSKAAVQIEEQVLELLNQERPEPQIIFIQGDAGQGKTVFYRMFGDRVRRELFPSFTPILIRLRELRQLARNLTETLETHLEHWEFVPKDGGWLSDRNQRFLFLLDGFDELVLQGGVRSGETGGLKDFLEQVVQFQRDSHHRFVITGRPLSLQGIDRLISQSENLARLALCPMGDGERDRWLKKWEAKFGKEERSGFEGFLKACPKDVNDKLAREPLLLYMLGRMHRERAISAADLQGRSGMRSKVKVYDEAIRWVLEKQRENENLRITGLDCDQLRQLMTKRRCV
jgi:NACHT domain